MAVTPGKAAGDLGGAVGGVVVDHDQFPVAAEVEDVFRLRDKRLDACTETLLFVPRGNDDGEFDQRLGFGLVENGASAGGNGQWLAGLIGEAEYGLPSPPD